jgi:hypothetical protein
MASRAAGADDDEPMTGASCGAAPAPAPAPAPAAAAAAAVTAPAPAPVGGGPVPLGAARVGKYLLGKTLGRGRWSKCVPSSRVLVLSACVACGARRLTWRT